MENWKLKSSITEISCDRKTVVFEYLELFYMGKLFIGNKNWPSPVDCLWGCLWTIESQIEKKNTLQWVAYPTVDMTWQGIHFHIVYETLSTCRKSHRQCGYDVALKSGIHNSLYLSFYYIYEFVCIYVKINKEQLRETLLESVYGYKNVPTTYTKC